MLNGFSAHADQGDLLEYADQTKARGKLRQIALVHGEPKAQRVLRELLQARGHDEVVMPILRHWRIFELEGLEGLHFTRAQYRQLAVLLRVLARRYPLVDAVGHEHVAPGRKADPGPAFDWVGLHRKLRQPRPALPFAARTQAG